MQVIIERDRPDEHTLRLVLQNPMDFTHGQRGIRQMLQNFGHHDRVETFVAKINREGEIHFRAGDPFACHFHRRRIDVHPDPANDSDHLRQHSATAADVQAKMRMILAVQFEPAPIERAFDLFVLGPDRRVVGGVLPRVAPVLVQLLDQATSPIRLVQQKLFRKFLLAHLVGGWAVGNARKIKLPSQAGLAKPSR